MAVRLQRIVATVAPVLAASLFLASHAAAQITFTPPADAPKGGPGTVGILEVINNGGLGDQNAARTSLQSATGLRTTGFAANVDYEDSGGGANFAGNRAFLSSANGGPAKGGIDNIAVLYRGGLRIPTAGAYTFGVNSDDGFTLAFNGGTVPFTGTAGANANNPTRETYNGNANGAIQFFGGRGVADSFGQITFAQPGVYDFDLTFHEGTGGAAVEFFAAQGTRTAFDANVFSLVGAAAVPDTQEQRQNRRRYGGTTTGNWSTIHIQPTDNASKPATANTAATIATYNALLADPAGTNDATNAPNSTVTRSTAATVLFSDPQGAGIQKSGYTYSPFPGNTTANDDNFGSGARVNFTVDTTSRYTFDILSDDGMRFRVLDSAGNPVALAGFNGTGVSGVDVGGPAGNDAITTGDACCNDAFARYDLTGGQSYIAEVIMHEGGGGSSVGVFSAIGEYTFFNEAFQALGQNLDQANVSTVTTQFKAGIVAFELVPEPTSLGLLGVGALGLLARRRRGA